MKKLPELKALYLFLVLLFFISACNDDDNVKISDDSNNAINTWVYDVMKEVYYWTDQIPARVNKEQAPEAFFKSLKYSGDDFSIIVSDFQELIKALEGVTEEAGYEYDLFYVDGGGDAVVAIVSYVKKNSPASFAGLKRGDVISLINGTPITEANWSQLYEQMFSSHSLTFSRFVERNEVYELQPEINLTVTEIQENPNYLDTVYTVKGRKVGYYVYNFFAGGLTNSNEYDQQMDAVFARFQSQGITDLVLDLRYNSGGAISSSLNMASLIAPNVTTEDVFFENRWNDFYMDYFNNDEDGDKNYRGRFIDKAANIGNQLNGKVYILTGSNTASASELIINGLKPYMDVELIGDKTVGKNVGSVAIEDERNSLNHYGLLPIAFQVYNSDGNSEYSEGFFPDIVIDDYALPMKALGDMEENLLSVAISRITGDSPQPSRISGGKIERRKIMSSIDRKLRSNRLIIEDGDLLNQ